MEGITPAGPAVIAGVAVDDSGRPLAEVVITLEEAPVPVPDVGAITGADGRFAFAAPTPGTYRVTARLPGCAPATATVQVGTAGLSSGAPETARVELRLLPE